MWMGVLFVGLVMLYAVRMSVPVTIVTIAQEMDWDKRICVSGRRWRRKKEERNGWKRRGAGERGIRKGGMGEGGGRERARGGKERNEKREEKEKHFIELYFS